MGKNFTEAFEHILFELGERITIFSKENFTALVKS